MDILHEDLRTYVIIYRSFLIGMKTFADNAVNKNQNTHFVFFFQNRSVYEIKRKNKVQPDRQQIKIQRMRILC